MLGAWCEDVYAYQGRVVVVRECGHGTQVGRVHHVDGLVV